MRATRGEPETFASRQLIIAQILSGRLCWAGVSLCDVISFGDAREEFVYFKGSGRYDHL